jgi:hypothetical protein
MCECDGKGYIIQTVVKEKLFSKSVPYKMYFKCTCAKGQNRTESWPTVGTKGYSQPNKPAPNLYNQNAQQQWTGYKEDWEL